MLRALHRSVVSSVRTVCTILIAPSVSVFVTSIIAGRVFDTVMEHADINGVEATIKYYYRSDNDGEIRWNNYRRIWCDLY